MKICKQSIILIFLFIICNASMIFAGGPYYVSTNGSDLNNGLSIANAFQTIQKGVNASILEITSTTCYIAPGYYNEHVEIKSNINNKTIVITRLSNDSSVLTSISNSFSITYVNNIIIKGLIINKCNYFGIYISGDSTNNKIINNIIVSNQYAGIYLKSPSRNNKIISNQIYGWNQNRGIDLNGSKQNIIFTNRIFNNQSDGIVLGNGANDNKILNNQIFSNGFGGGGYAVAGILSTNNWFVNNKMWGFNQFYGIELSFCNNNLVQSNLFFQNVVGFGAQYGNYNTVVNNTFLSNSQIGVVLFDFSDHNIVKNNFISGINQIKGIYIEESKFNLIKSNYIFMNGGYGISIYAFAVSNYIADNFIDSNLYSGIYLDWDCDHNYIYTNTIKGFMQTYGIIIDDSDNTIVRGNDIFFNSLAGVFINKGKYNNLEDNKIHFNQYYGVYITNNNSYSNNLVENDLYLNFDTGIKIIQSDYDNIYGNMLHNNGFRGIYLLRGAQNQQIARNQISTNHDQGIYINDEDADNHVIYSNSIWGMHVNGIRIANADNIKIYRNLLCDSLDPQIYIEPNSTDVDIFNNTIFRSTSDGINIESTGDFFLLNNIILSNGDNAFCYGINNVNSGVVRADYNIFYGNFGGPTNSGIIMGTHNIFTNPMIDTVSSFTIVSENSPAVDSGTNIPGVSDVYFLSGPDIGWKEACFYIPGSDSTPPQTVINNPGGSYMGTLTVKLTAVDSQSIENTIYYTLDGTDPASSSTAKSAINTVSININQSLILKYYAKDQSGNKEPVHTQNYDILLVPVGKVAVYNNYFDLNNESSARIIINEPGYAEVSIYNLRGDLIKLYTRKYYIKGTILEWDGTSGDTQNKVGAGIYIVIIQGDHINEKRKLIVRK